MTKKTTKKPNVQTTFQQIHQLNPLDHLPRPVPMLGATNDVWRVRKNMATLLRMFLAHHQQPPVVGGWTNPFEQKYYPPEV